MSEDKEGRKVFEMLQTCSGRYYDDEEFEDFED